MIKNNKRTLIATSIVILLPCIAGIIFKSSMMIIVPFVILAIHWLCVLVTACDSHNKNQSKKTIGAVLWITPIVSVFSCALLCITSLDGGLQLPPAAVMSLVFAAIFIAIGNYMPKTKQNRTIGIKIKPTLESAENWNATHRFAGRIWFAGGILILFTAFLPEHIAFICIMICIAILVLIPLIYSYRFRAKQIKEGTLDISASIVYPRKYYAVSVIIGVAILAVITVIMFTGEVELTLSEDTLTVNATYWEGTEIAYSDIENVEFSDSFSFGVKTNGFNSAKLLLGMFRNAEGVYTSYCYNSCDNAVIIRTADETFVINADSGEATKMIYEALTEKTK